MGKLIGASAVAVVCLSGCSLLPGVKQYDNLESGPGSIIQPVSPQGSASAGGNVNSPDLSEMGNKSPYSVNGKFYYVMEDPAHYRARGKASWYGNKFHGGKTSSGETFDMYAMTAAHRNLPLPTYLEVTNLDNGNVAIVKVNDRGPFVDDRLIDLSFAAAQKLGIMDSGDAPVELRALTGADIPAARARVEKDSADAKAMASSQTAGQSDDRLIAMPVVEEPVGDDLMKSAEQVAEDSSTLVAAETAAVGAEVVEQVAEVVPALTPEQAEAPAAPAEEIEDSTSPIPLVIQIGAFRQPEPAIAYMEKAQEVLPSLQAFVAKGMSGDRPIYRVRIGPVNTRKMIAAAQASLEAGDIPDSRVLPMHSGGDCVAGCR